MNGNDAVVEPASTGAFPQPQDSEQSGIFGQPHRSPSVWTAVARIVSADRRTVDITDQRHHLYCGQRVFRYVRQTGMGHVSFDDAGDDEQRHRTDHHLNGVFSVSHKGIAARKFAGRNQCPSDKQSGAGTNEDGR